ncbi:PIN domain-containing protein [Kutzneria viridogrisea]|uniref:Nucleic acid-binding protein n=1 Tax=Kutzneria viridogrisea TaxID=47990 RepID=A0ABR6BIX2_9PSEU|nr:putative nucleic acid-binding protein [Kutzneria viridogrisea]
MFTALLDTCTLWPSLRRDFLLSLAIEGLYRPVWSTVILEELEYEEARKLVSRGSTPEDAEQRARYLITRMHTAFNDALVEGWEALEGSYGLPDPNDEHVLAAAVVANAGAIVTENLTDFPVDKVPSTIDVIPPHVFAANTVEVSPGHAFAAVKEIAQRSGRSGPPLTPADIVTRLESRYRMYDAANLLRPLL